MAEFALPALLLGTGLQMYQQYRGGREQAAMFDQRASVAAEEAAATRKASKYEAEKTIEKGERFVETQKTGFASRGIRPYAGTVPMVTAESMAEFQEEARIILETGTTQAKRLESQAEWERKMGKSRRKSSLWQMGTTATTGAFTLGLGAKRGWW